MLNDNYPKRHPENKELKLYYGSEYRGLPVMYEKGALIEPYLEKMYNTIKLAMNHYPKVFAFRVDIHFPNNWIHDDMNDKNVIERFISSFRAKIKSSRQTAKLNENYHDSVVRYVWCREIGKYGRPHYHFLILLNGNAFSAMGAVNSPIPNTYSRLSEAWASALGLDVVAVKGLVNKVRSFFTEAQGYDLGELFYVSSYLCKAGTKYYGDGRRNFGVSRV